MPINRQYHTWIHIIRELRPGQRLTQVRSFAWLLVGIHHSRLVTPSKIAGKIPGEAKLLSGVRRLGRFLNNPAIRVRDWYEPLARQWLAAQFHHLGEIRLVVDGTQIGSRHPLLIVCLTYCKRAIPLAWTWVKHARGHSTGIKQLALLAYIRRLIPLEAAVFLVGDCEFGSVPVLRQSSDTGIWFSEQAGWQPFGSHIQKPGPSFWLGTGYLTAAHIYRVNLLVHWKRGEKEPGCLATNLPDKRMALRFYRLRGWIEEMFGDFKKHGFDLEHTRLCHFQRLSRLTLVVAFLYVWLVSVGTRTIQAGNRHLVDRHDRRDLCIFQIGLRIIERPLTNALAFKIPLCSYRYFKTVG